MNLNHIYYIRLAEETILFLTFIFICAALTKSRFSAKKTAVILLSGTLLCAVLNAAVLLVSHDAALTIGMLPLTAYIPAIMVLHLLSDSGFFRTTPIWCTGLLGMYTECIALKITSNLCTVIGCTYYRQDIIEFLTLFAITSILCFVTARYIRRPFHRYIRYSDIDWSLPTILGLLFATMFSYFSNSSKDLVEYILMVSATTVVLVLIAKLFWTEYTRQRLKKEQKEYEARIRIQQKEFQEITRKHEQLREYRHDMRHHLLALGNILRDSDNHYAEEYIDTLVQRLEQTETIIYSKNQMINAVLSSYITRAKEVGCVLDTQISIPEKTQIEPVDLCAVLSNALENAIHACEKEDEEHRFIKIKIVYKNVLTISIKNSCSKEIVFDKNNLPTAIPMQGHGIGMKSIANTVEKYGGTLQCECADGEFSLNILMFHAAHAAKNVHEPHTKNTRRIASAVLFSLIGLCAFLNLSPAVTQTLAELPVVGPVVQVITARHLHSGWGDSQFDVEEPKVTLELSMPPVQNSPSESTETEVSNPVTMPAAVPSAEPAPAETTAPSNVPAVIEAAAPSLIDTDELSTEEAPVSSALPQSYAVFNTPKLSSTAANAQEHNGVTFPAMPETATESPALEEGVQEINDKMSEYTETLRQAYHWYLIRKYMGYTSLESTYSVLCNNEDMLSIKIYGTLNVGGSADFNRYFILDKRTGSVIELADLFQKGADYITPISSEILKQMTRQVESGKGVYFIPGGIWSDNYCFKSISQEQNFYINDQGKLVIAFNEYEVAPGSMGCVEFVIPTDVIDSILSKPSLIQ